MARDNMQLIKTNSKTFRYEVLLVPDHQKPGWLLGHISVEPIARPVSKPASNLSEIPRDLNRNGVIIVRLKLTGVRISEDIGRTMPHLTHLTLSGCEVLTGSGISGLARLTSLVMERSLVRASDFWSPTVTRLTFDSWSTNVVNEFLRVTSVNMLVHVPEHAVTPDTFSRLLPPANVTVVLSRRDRNSDCSAAISATEKSLSDLVGFSVILCTKAASDDLCICRICKDTYWDNIR